jgi:hypothetical protein
MTFVNDILEKKGTIMKKKQIIVLLLVILNLTFAGVASSQNVNEIFHEFRKLELYMLKIWELVQHFNDQQAIGYMAMAKAEIDKARDLLYASQPRYTLARIHMAKAKRYTDLAARVVLSKPFLNLKSQLDNLINRADKEVSDSDSDEAHYLLNQAKKFRQLAYTAFKQNKLVKGGEYFRIAFFFAQKCIDYLKSSEMNLLEQYENLEMSVRQLLGQADEFLANNEKNYLKTLLREAEEHFEDAMALATEGKLQMAINRLRLIKRLLYRVFDQAERDVMSSEERLKSNLYTLRSFLEALEREVNRSQDNTNKILLDKSWQLFREAEQNYENGNYAASRLKISICQRFANKLFKLTKSKPISNVDNLEEQLRETQNLLILQEDRVQTSNDKSIMNLYQEANRMLERAQQALSSNKLGIAYQLIQAATRMSARIQRELRKASNNIERAALERKYQQVTMAINNLENNEEIQIKYAAILKQIKSFAERGKKYMDEGNFILADEYFSTAWEQIKQYTDKWRK